MATMSSVGERTLQNSARPHYARTLGAERSAHLVVLAQDGRDDDDAAEEGKPCIVKQGVLLLVTRQPAFKAKLYNALCCECIVRSILEYHYTRMACCDSISLPYHPTRFFAAAAAAAIYCIHILAFTAEGAPRLSVAVQA